MEMGEDGEAGEAEAGDSLLSAADDAGAAQPSWAALHSQLMRSAGAEEAGETTADRDGAQQANGKQAR